MTKTIIDKLQEFAVSLRNWISKAQVKVVVNTAIDDASWCESRNGKHLIVLTDNEVDSVGHEYGHTIFDTVFNEYETYPDCSAVKAMCNTWFSGLSVSVHLDLESMRHNVGRHDLSTVADIMGMYLDADVPDYECHDVGYAAEHVDDYKDGVNHIYEDEWFANICGLVYEGNWNALTVIHEMFPMAVESCFDIMEMAMDILKEMAREIRNKYFICTTNTRARVEIPLDILTYLHLILLWHKVHH